MVVSWKVGVKMFDITKYCAGVEVDKCRGRLKKYCVGAGLDIGCGGINSDTRFYWENKIVPTAIGVDLSRTNLVGKAHRLYWFSDVCLDYIFSSHLLEHLADPTEALIEWFRVLKVGGLIVLYLPLEGYYPSVGEEGANFDHKVNLKPHYITAWLNDAGLSFEMVHVEERIDDDEYSFDLVLRKR